MDARSSLPTSVRSSHIVSSSHNRSGSADTQSNGGPPKRHALRIYFRARTAPPAASAQGRLRVNRVDFATSALASAIHNTGHSRPIGTGLPVALPRPNCKRPAQPRQLRRSALDRLRDMSCSCGRQRPGISTAPNPRGSCSRRGGRVAIEGAADGYYVRPALVEMVAQTGPVEQETFAPILYVMKYSDFDEVLELHNGVAQGLSSSIFTNDLRGAATFLSQPGSDCGIANVNIAPSGPGMGGAVGDAKETSGGSEYG